MADDQRDNQDQAELEQNPEENQQQRRWTRGNTKGCLIILGVLAGIIVLIGVCNALLGNGDDGVATQMPTQTPTLHPTSAPSCPTPDEAAYLEEQAAALDLFEAAREKMHGLIVRLGEDPGIRTDQAWDLEMTAAFGMFHDFRDQVENMSPPPSLRSIHEGMTEMRKLTGYFTSNISVALDQAGDDLVKAIHLGGIMLLRAEQHCQ